MDHVSVVTRDTQHRDGLAGAEVKERVGNKADEGAGVGAVSGGALGGLTGLLVGLGTLAIPGVGPIMLAGAAATAIATTLAGGAIGAASGGLLGGLIGLGLPEKEARHYNERVEQGDYLVIVDGTVDEIHRAESLLKRQGIRDWTVNEIPVATANQTQTAVEHASPVVAPLTSSDATLTQRDLNQRDRAPRDESVKLYEERLVVDKDREKTGEVTVNKRVETETAQVSVPIEKERVVIERVTPTAAAGVAPGSDAFHEGEAVRVEVYEETPEIRKEAFVREEVGIHKEVTQETVRAEETLRREELNIDTQGHPTVNDPSNTNTRDRA
ncbi:MAG: DUF2382 domain-containing protein [Myxacorys californica WJT36-NPBG1]|nr:DUF2382 domain-containing protein [Myxacorys californica WJT36-NPBG1]